MQVHFVNVQSSFSIIIHFMIYLGDVLKKPNDSYLEYAMYMSAVWS